MSYIVANSQAEIELCTNFLALHCDKTITYRQPICAVRFLCPSSSKHNFTVPLKIILFLNYCTFKIFIMTFLQICQNAERYNKLKTKARYENSTVKLVFEKLSNPYRTSFPLCFSRSKHNSQLAPKNCLVIETHLTIT